MMSFETTKKITGAEQTMTAGEICAALEDVPSTSKPIVQTSWRGNIKSITIITLTDESGDHIRDDRKHIA